MIRIQPIVENYSQLPAGRLRIVDRFEDVRLTGIRRGIVFVFASWSGPAVVALRRFTRVMSSLDTRLLDLVVLDTDCLAEDAATHLFGTDGFRAGGNGETLWVRDGRIVAREIAAPAASEPWLVRHTNDLLQDPAT